MSPDYTAVRYTLTHAHEMQRSIWAVDAAGGARRRLTSAHTNIQAIQTSNANRMKQYMLVEPPLSSKMPIQQNVAATKLIVMYGTRLI